MYIYCIIDDQPLFSWSSNPHTTDGVPAVYSNRCFFITILWACVFSIPQDRCSRNIFTSCHLLSLKFCSTFTMFFWQYCMWAFTIKWIFICFRNIHIYLRIPARLSCFSIFATTIFGSEAKFSCRFLFFFLLGQQFFFFQQAVYSCSLNYRTVNAWKRMVVCSSDPDSATFYSAKNGSCCCGEGGGRAVNEKCNWIIMV